MRYPLLLTKVKLRILSICGEKASMFSFPSIVIYIFRVYTLLFYLLADVTDDVLARYGRKVITY